MFFGVGRISAVTGPPGQSSALDKRIWSLPDLLWVNHIRRPSLSNNAQWSLGQCWELNAAISAPTEAGCTKVSTASATSGAGPSWQNPNASGSPRPSFPKSVADR
jgi:hypothetical protein